MSLRVLPRCLHCPRTCSHAIQSIFFVYAERHLPQQPFQVGLLPRHNDEQIRFAWQTFKRTDKESWKIADGFKRTFSRDVEVTFVGVWYVHHMHEACNILMGPSSQGHGF